MLLNEELLDAELQVQHDDGTINHTDGQVLAFLFSALIGDCRDLVRHRKCSNRFRHA